MGFSRRLWRPQELFLAFAIKRRRIKQFIDEYQLHSHVRLLGFVSYDRFVDELDRADVFVAPSVTSGPVIVKAELRRPFSRHRPPACRSWPPCHADIPFVVCDGTTALLAPERDVMTLKRHLRFFIDHPEALTTFGRAGRSFVEDRHDIRREACELERRYRALL